MIISMKLIILIEKDCYANCVINESVCDGQERIPFIDLIDKHFTKTELPNGDFILLFNKTDTVVSEDLQEAVNDFIDALVDYHCDKIHLVTEHVYNDADTVDDEVDDIGEQIDTYYSGFIAGTYTNDHVKFDHPSIANVKVIN